MKTGMDAEEKVPVGDEANAFIQSWKERNNETDADRGVLDRWVETVRPDGGGAVGNLPGTSDRKTAGIDDGLSGVQSESQRGGYSEEDGRDFDEDLTLDEELP